MFVANASKQHLINSPLGVASGDIYNTYFNLVRANNPPKKEHPYFQRLIAPLLQRETTPLDDSGEMGLDEEIEEMLEERRNGQSGSDSGIGEEEPESGSKKA